MHHAGRYAKEKTIWPIIVGAMRVQLVQETPALERDRDREREREMEREERGMARWPSCDWLDCLTFLLHSMCW